MGNAVDFEKVRKRRRRATTLKRLLILAGVMLLVIGAVFLYQILVEEGATVTLSDLTESFGGAGFPADLPGGLILGVNNIGNNLMVLNDTNLYIYSPKAKIIRNIQKMTEQTVAIPSQNRVLTFALAGKSFYVHSLSRELYSNELEYGIICGDMNDNGDFAVVAPVKQFASRVYVYNKKFEEIYKWSSPEFISNVSISPRGDSMALNCVSGNGGALESLIYIFRFGEESEKAKVAASLKESLCLDVSFLEDERIAVLTDRQYLIFNSLGEEKYGYDFAGGQISAVERQGKNTLLMFYSRERKNSRLVFLDANLSEKAVLDINGEILDMAVAKDLIYVLTADGISVYGHDLTLRSTFVKRNISNIHITAGKLYYLTNDEICVLSQSELTAAEKQGQDKQARQRRGG